MLRRSRKRNIECMVQDLNGWFEMHMLAGSERFRTGAVIVYTSKSLSDMFLFLLSHTFTSQLPVKKKMDIRYSCRPFFYRLPKHRNIASMVSDEPKNRDAFSGTQDCFLTFENHCHVPASVVLRQTSLNLLSQKHSPRSKQLCKFYLKYVSKNSEYLAMETSR